MLSPLWEFNLIPSRTSSLPLSQLFIRLLYLIFWESLCNYRSSLSQFLNFMNSSVKTCLILFENISVQFLELVVSHFQSLVFKLLEHHHSHFHNFLFVFYVFLIWFCELLLTILDLLDPKSRFSRIPPWKLVKLSYKTFQSNFKNLLSPLWEFNFIPSRTPSLPLS